MAFCPLYRTELVFPKVRRWLFRRFIWIVVEFYFRSVFVILAHTEELRASDYETCFIVHTSPTQGPIAQRRKHYYYYSILTSIDLVRSGIGGFLTPAPKGRY